MADAVDLLDGPKTAPATEADEPAEVPANKPAVGAYRRKAS